MYKSLPLDAIALQQPVPVNVWDGQGVLLLRKGEVITSEQHRGLLMLHGPVVLDADWKAWSYSYTTQLDRMVRDDASLTRIASLSHAHAPEVPHAPARDEVGLVEFWSDLHASLTTLLQQGEAAPQFLERIDRIAARVRDRWRASPDGSFLVLVQLLFDARMGYSTTHALLCGGLCALVSPLTELTPAEQHALLRAALTMNIAMTRAHDAMARQTAPLSAAQRETVQAHPLKGVAVLRQLGVTDALWLQLVAEQHERPDGSGYPAGTRTTGMPQRLLQIADVYVARLSPREDRGGGVAQHVARGLLMGADQRPDPLAALFIKHVGIYPPGSYVRLANDEVAVVARRGGKPSTPQVLSIIGRQGMPLGEPTLRDTLEPPFAIKSGLAPGDVRVVVNVTRLLSRL
ncbi:HD-GYP domain-containing protein [Hydrogenophaga sp.]|uniref:HD-GYP domain-containing protein n=1 Tax=Hydrogenophaga sp. TaxID=1904254 RepID=UPI0027192FAB|nr:HD domain-containing phosphohydrolase [Hydrogenophaga sp.]MDO9434600.1 HD domain-containing phosphohydrolase [Hydrogenophaga sp.]